MNQTSKITLRICLMVFGIIMLAQVNAADAELTVGGDSALAIMSNGKMTIAVSRSEGTIRRLINLEDSVDYCNQIVGVVWPKKNVPVGERIGGVVIFDELKRQSYSDLDDPGVVSGFKVEKGTDSAVLSFEKQYPGADFVVLERLEMREDHLRWTVKTVKKTGKDRSLKLVQLLPLPTWGYKAWAPIAEARSAPIPGSRSRLITGQSMAVRWATPTGALLSRCSRFIRGTRKTH